MYMSSIAIITARGGSKRIPRKNIREFLGKPIISYSITAALESGIFDEVMVSTDDLEIAEIARAFGAKTPFMRSEKNSDDYATTSDVIKEVLMKYKEQDQSFTLGCCIYPTAPFVNAEILQKAFQIMQEQQYVNVVLPVVPYGFPVQRSFKKSSDNKLVYAQPEYINTRSQDLEKYFHDTGQFYMFNVDSFLDRGSLAAPCMYGIEVSELDVQDIDNETDWKLAELKYSLRAK